jgi:hypothetical protein
MLKPHLLFWVSLSLGACIKRHITKKAICLKFVSRLNRDMSAFGLKFFYLNLLSQTSFMVEDKVTDFNYISLVKYTLNEKRIVISSSSECQSHLMCKVYIFCHFVNFQYANLQCALYSYLYRRFLLYLSLTIFQFLRCTGKYKISESQYLENSALFPHIDCFSNMEYMHVE